MNNVVQIEFFHVNMSASADDFFADCRERIWESLQLQMAGVASRPNIKTVVRFFDTTNVFTRLIALYEKLNGICDHDFFDKILGANIFTRQWLKAKRRIFKKIMLLLHNLVLFLTIKKMQSPPHYSSEIAIERYDFSFQPIQPNELYEVLQACKKSRRVWVFLFSPNTLYAEKNDLLASMTF